MVLSDIYTGRLILVNLLQNYILPIINLCTILINLLFLYLINKQIMSKVGPIIVIEDDEDDQFLIQEAISELHVENTVILFNNGLQAHEYLLITKDQPLVILCDINMPVMNGLELRDLIENNPYLKKKAIPFIFLSTSDNAQLIEKAYRGTIQGFYKKSSNFLVFRTALDSIIRYWKLCLHPNNLADSHAAQSGIKVY